MGPVTPARAPVVVDISTIEQQKENIQPLASGRSAAQLASLNSLPRSGLGAKLSSEHKHFQSQIDAIDHFEREGTWEDGRDGLSADEVATLAEDPLDVHHQYVRFVLANYPAGASATSKLVPLLEASTRRFLSDERYKNDPRYLRLWVQYAKNMECPEDCYRFLFAKNIGDRLASLYEEYALVLEASGKRKQADQIYCLGIERKAAPLDRLKKRYESFQARMLVARDPSPPSTASVLPATSSLTARPALSGIGGIASSSSRPVANGKKFAIFQDQPDQANAVESKENWEDLGTVASRTSQNTIEAAPWKGETMHMAATTKPKTPLKLEIYRDQTNDPGTAASTTKDVQHVFSRSIRGPSEAEVLRLNPFKNYSDADLSLRSIDPLENVSMTKPAKKASSSAAASSSKEGATKSGKERVAIDLKAVYPSAGVELSFEELRGARRSYRSDAQSWRSWESLQDWQTEVDSLQIRHYKIDRVTGLPLLFDDETGAPLYRFLRPPTPPQPQKRPKPPSPTINTLAAEAMMNDLFAKTLNFDRKAMENGEDSSESDDENDEDEDESRAHWAHDQASQVESVGFTQEDSMLATQESNPPFAPFSQSSSQAADSFLASQVSFVTEEELPTVVSSSQTSRALLELNEQVGEDDVETRQAANPTPMKLFTDQANPSKAAFKPSRQVVTAPVVDQDDEDVFEVAETQQSDAEEYEDGLGDHEVPLSDENQSVGFGDGYAMGRKPFGASKYASFVDNMTPITERTAEYNVTGTVSSYGSLSSSQRSRRDSAFPITEAVQEEDEEEASTEDDEEDDDVGDRAFVVEEDAESDSRDGSSTESDSEDDIAVPASHLHHARHDSSQTESSFGSHLNLAGLASALPADGTHAANEAHSSHTDSTATATQGRVSILPNPCNPYLADTISAMLSLAPSSILQHRDVVDVRSSVSQQLQSMQRMAKKREASQKKKDSTGVIDEPWELELADDLYSVRQKLGEGSFGAVFRAVETNEDALLGDDYDEDEVSLAVKIERPANLWEFYILNAMHERMDARTRESIIAARRLYAYQDESFLVLEYCDQGTLLDAVNKAHESGIAPPTAGATGLDEPVAMFFTIELLRTLSAMHRSGFIHGDLKIDNCLVRLDQVPGGSKNWSNEYDPSGSNGWSHKGLKLIDFGRSIDLSLFPSSPEQQRPQQTFVSTLPTDEFDCHEMRRGEAWSFEPDYFGAASIVYNLLFGRYIETKSVERPDGTTWHTINQNIRRYHQVELWTRLFDVLLNSREVGRQTGAWPVTDELDRVRAEMESWLVANCERSGRSLKALIRKIEIFAMSG